MTIHRFSTLNDVFEAAHEIEMEFKEEKVSKYKNSSSNSWSKNKGGAQTSSSWNKGTYVKKTYEKKPFEGNTPKYHQGRKVIMTRPKCLKVSNFISVEDGVI